MDIIRRRIEIQFALSQFRNWFPEHKVNLVQNANPAKRAPETPQRNSGEPEKELA